MQLREASTTYQAPRRNDPKHLRKVAVKFTRENAREMQRRSMESRRLRKLELMERVRKAAECDPFIAERLGNVRALIHRLEGMAHRQRDAAKLAHLSKALATLTRTEAELAGRTRTKTQAPSPGAAPLIQAEE